MTAATPSTPVSSAVRSWGRARTTIEPSASARAAPAAIAIEAVRLGSEIAPRFTCAVTPSRALSTRVLALGRRYGAREQHAWASPGTRRGHGPGPVHRRHDRPLDPPARRDRRG